MEHDDAAKRLAELGNSTRLAIFRLLVKAGPEGLPVGQIQLELDIPGSTLSHHISRLVRVGLVVQARESRTLHCLPQYQALTELIDYLQLECCSGLGKNGC
ncbi:ArsR/SmtB family transcription factor [Magnetococcus sp. PR-3]|uniref:ArsR/SmtB family transcription factor n=1 Tax=Magnetococcus sp. PR-3 TaxID=3120355 RepID=UPI002FCE0734